MCSAHDPHNFDYDGEGSMEAFKYCKAVTHVLLLLINAPWGLLGLVRHVTGTAKSTIPLQH